jgi:hypothetical protein
MWLFTRHGFIDLVEHPHPDHADKLLIRTQVEDDMTAFVRLLDEETDTQHTINSTVDGDYRFIVIARKEVVAKVVGNLVAGIDYSKFKQASHFDLGKDNTFVVMLGPNDLQVARLLVDETAAQLGISRRSVYAPERAANPTARKRFLRKARAAAAISPPPHHAFRDVGAGMGTENRSVVGAGTGKSDAFHQSVSFAAIICVT